MTWNYRILRRVSKVGNDYEDISHAIHEVFYDKHGQPDSATAYPVYPHGETVDDMLDDIDRYMEALKKPVLDYDTLQEAEPAPITDFSFTMEKSYND